jgi:hypothetical protein
LSPAGWCATKVVQKRAQKPLKSGGRNLLIKQQKQNHLIGHLLPNLLLRSQKPEARSQRNPLVPRHRRDMTRPTDCHRMFER